MFRNYLVTALRVLRRNPLYAIINIFGLAFSLACVIGIALFVFDELSVDRFHRNYNSIYRVVERKEQADAVYNTAGTPGPLAFSLREEYPEVVNATRVGRKKGVLKWNETTISSEEILAVDPTFFDVFSFPLLLGTTERIFNNPDEILVSESTAENLFGASWRNRPIMGSIISMGEHNFKLAGVVANAPANSTTYFDALLPFAFEEKNNPQAQRWNSNNYFSYLQLKASADFMSLQNSIHLYLKKHLPETKTTLLLQPLKDIYLKSKFDFDTDYGKRSDILYVKIFSAVGIIILLIAIANFINLTTARAITRAREIGVRKVIGAERSYLVVQFLVEAIVLTFISVISAMAILQLSLPLLNELSAKKLVIPFDSKLFWIFAIAFAVVLGLIAGLLPAIYLSSFRAITVMKGVFNAGSGKRFRSAMVVGQFSLSIILAVATIVIYRQLNFIQTKNLGFDKEHLLYIHLDGEARLKYPMLVKELKNIPGVSGVSATSETFINSSSSTSEFSWPGKQTSDQSLIYEANIDDHLIETMGLQLTSGRNFSGKVVSDTSAESGPFIINETAAKTFGFTASSAIGKNFSMWGKEGEIIGVVKDFHYRPLQSSIEPLAMRYRPAEGYSELLLKIQGSAVPSTLSNITKLYSKYEPRYPMNYGFMEENLEALYESEKRIGSIVMVFSLLAVFVSCLGLFGLTTFYTSQRVKEIGIRKLLGSSVTNIVSLLSISYISFVIVAIIVAMPVAWVLMNTWLQNYAYRVNLSWWIFAAVGCGAVIIAFITVLFRCIAAAMANPVRSLRE